MGLDVEPGVTPKPAVEPLSEQPKTVLPKPILATINKDTVASILCDEFSELINKAAADNKLDANTFRGIVQQGLAGMEVDDLFQLLKNVESGKPPVGNSPKDLGSRVGIGQVVMLSAGAIESRDSGVRADEHTSSNFDRIAQEQQDPAKSLDTLAKVLKENRALYTEVPGKTAADRMMFAAAKHLLGIDGRNIIGAAQETLALAAGAPANAINSWEQVSNVLSQGKYQEIMERVSAAFKNTPESSSPTQLASTERK